MTEPPTRIPSPRDKKGRDQTQRKGFGYVVAVLMAALLFVAAKTVYDDGNAPFGNASLKGTNARPAT